MNGWFHFFISSVCCLLSATGPFLHIHASIEKNCFLSSNESHVYCFRQAKMAGVTTWCVVLALVPPIIAHSWLACTDYLEENGEYWDVSKCRAFPRHAHQFAPKTLTFGHDTGYNIINPPNNQPCRTPRNDNEGYNNEHPMAVYFPGQRVVITHPTKVRNNGLAGNVKIKFLGPAFLRQSIFFLL